MPRREYGRPCMLYNVKISLLCLNASRLKADPTARDNEGRGVLHYVAAYNPNNNNRGPFINRMLKLSQYFLQKGVSPFQVNAQEKTPLQTALGNLIAQGTVRLTFSYPPPLKGLIINL